jgi:NTE family protein
MPSTTSRTGLSLSGGGYRATAFHLGTLKKLYEMKILSKVDVLSTISGGSIAGAAYCSNQGNFDSFYNSLYEGLQRKNVIRNVLLSFTFLQLILFALIFLGTAFYFLFTPYPWLFPILFAAFFFLLLKFQFYIFPVSKQIEKIYDKLFYHNKTLDKLNERPVLVIGSTNLQTARTFTFSKYWMGDTTYEYLKPPITFKPADFPLARAVMASSCVPFAFTPVAIKDKYFTNSEDAKKVHPILVDGGVYDNQGIHKIMQHGRYACDIVITSDAGAGSTAEGNFGNTFTLLMQTVNVFMSRIKNVQTAEDVFDNAATANKQIAYLSLGWDVEKCIPGFITNLQSKQITKLVIEANKLKTEWVEDPKLYENEITDHLNTITGYAAIDKPTPEEKKIARSVGTSLTSLSKVKVDCLIKQAKALTELQVKLYCPTLI